MTQAYVVINEPCTICEFGEVHVIQDDGARTMGVCPFCGGAGTVQRRVRCRDCMSFSVDEEFAFEPFCIKFGNPVSPTHGCALWEAKP